MYLYTENESQDINSKWMNHLTELFKKWHLPFAPTFTHHSGIMLDFCCGLRVLLPVNKGCKKYRLQVYDFNSKLKMFDEVIDAGDYYVSEKKYFIDYGVIITDASDGREILRHRIDCREKDVVINMPVPTMGDSIAWFSSVLAFSKKHSCQVYAVMPEHTRCLFESDYPNIKFISADDIERIQPYASFQMGVDSTEDSAISPVDYRQVPLHEYGAYILGLYPLEVLPGAPVLTGNYGINKPYVCISTQASGLCKMWMHPDGWEKVVGFLNDSGYRVLDVDLHRKQYNGIFQNAIPRNAEDFTGNISLRERASLISGADFFIGLGSGLSWLANCCDVPVVLISGFSLPHSEFYTPYRVINYNVCHGCYSDTRYTLNPQEYDWCPKHKGTPRHFECTRGITPEMVIEKIKTIPAFQKHINKGEE